MKSGDRVKKSDADTATVPAYRDMRGTVEAVTPDGRSVRVHWDCDSTTEPGYRLASTVTLAGDS